MEHWAGRTSRLESSKLAFRFTIETLFWRTHFGHLYAWHYNQSCMAHSKQDTGLHVVLKWTNLNLPCSSPLSQFAPSMSFLVGQERKKEEED